MEEVFRIAGNVIEVDMKTDKDGRSRGMGTVRFEHPMEAVQAIGVLFELLCYLFINKYIYLLNVNCCTVFTFFSANKS